MHGNPNRCIFPTPAGASSARGLWTAARVRPSQGAPPPPAADRGMRTEDARARFAQRLHDDSIAWMCDVTRPLPTAGSTPPPLPSHCPCSTTAIPPENTGPGQTDRDSNRFHFLFIFYFDGFETHASHFIVRFVKLSFETAASAERVRGLCATKL